MPKSRNWFAIALTAGLLVAIGSSPLHAQIVVPLIRVIIVVGGAVETLYAGSDRAQAEAVHKANPGSKIEFGSKVRDLNDHPTLEQQKALRRRCNQYPDSSGCPSPYSGDFDHGDSLPDR